MPSRLTEMVAERIWKARLLDDSRSRTWSRFADEVRHLLGTYPMDVEFMPFKVTLRREPGKYLVVWLDETLDWHWMDSKHPAHTGTNSFDQLLYCVADVVAPWVIDGLRSGDRVQ